MSRCRSMCSGRSFTSSSIIRCRPRAAGSKSATPMSGSEHSMTPQGASEPPLLRIAGLRKSYGATEVLKGVDLDVARGEVVTIIGSSGSGKTTLLRCVNFLETYQAGSIRIADEEVGYRDAVKR